MSPTKAQRQPIGLAFFVYPSLVSHIEAPAPILTPSNVSDRLMSRRPNSIPKFARWHPKRLKKVCVFIIEPPYVRTRAGTCAWARASTQACLGARTHEASMHAIIHPLNLGVHASIFYPITGRG